MKRLLIAFLFASLVLVSCGGGGGGSSASPTNPTGNTTPSPTPSPTPTPTPTPTPSSSQTPSPTPTPTPVPSNLPISGAISLTNDFELDKASYEGSEEYMEQSGLALINASSAYARGATGVGSLIGVMDSGVDISHQELDGANKLTSDSYLVYSDRSPTTDEKRHGTHVSAIALGERDGSGMHGVAFDAQLFFISIKLGTAGEDYEPAQIDTTVDYTGVDSSWSQLEGVFVERGVTVVNGSFGYQGNINDYTEEDLRYAFPKTIEVMAQANKSDAEKTLFIWSAGNGGGYADQGVDYSSPEVFGGLAYRIAELRNNSAAVVSVDPDGTISSFSNRCGVAKDYCLAAPGRSITSAYAQDAPDNNYYAAYSGTSMAAPHVSGGIALLADFFDGQLGNTEILQRLFATANKTGIYADSDIYGQGLMDLDKATKPQGTATIATLGSIIGNQLFSIDSTKVFNLGPAFGGDFHTKTDIELIVVDSLGAPFKRKLNSKQFTNLHSPNWIASQQSSNLKGVQRKEAYTSFGTKLTFGINNEVSQPDHSYNLWADKQQRLKYFSFIHPLSENLNLFTGKGQSPSLYFGNQYENSNLTSNRFFSTGAPYLEMSSDGSFLGLKRNLSNESILSAAFFAGNHRDSQRYLLKDKGSQGFLMEYKNRNEIRSISIQGGVVDEREGILGSTFSGAFGLASSSTLFGGLELISQLGELEARGSFFIGKSNSKIKQESLFNSIDDFTSSSFELGFYKKGVFSQSDNIGFIVDQPLRIEQAEMGLSVPYRRTKDKEVLFKDIQLDMAPESRQFNAEVVYEEKNKAFGLSGRLGFSKNQNHLEANKIEPYFFIDFEFTL